MIALKVREFTSADDLMAHYKALKARQQPVVAPKAVVLPFPAPEPEVAPVAVAQPTPVKSRPTEYAWPIGPRHERDVLYIATQLEGVRRNARHIIEEVADKHGFKVAVLKSPWRNAKVCRARMECYYRLRTETNLSLPRIGLLIGGRDHTSVLHGVNRFAKLLAEGVVTL